jgi:heme exporter protein A
MVAAQTSNVLLKVENLVCFRHDRPVHLPLSFSLVKGQVLWIEGQNGSGKSTLIRSLIHLNPTWEGSLSWHLPPSHRFHYLGHDNGLVETLSIREWLRLEKLARHPQTPSLLAQWGLEHFLTTPLRFLSAGQKRRLALLGLFLKTQPGDVWVLDEPTHSLDSESCTLFHKFLHRHCEAGGASLMSTHDPLWRHFWPHAPHLSLSIPRGEPR